MKERILEKAKEIFMRYGVRSVSMDDIAAQLGMSKKTIYQYYADKDELVESVMDQHISESEQEIIDYSRNAQNAVEEVLLITEMVERQFRNLNPIVLHDLEKFHPKAFRKIHQHKYEFMLHAIRNNMERGRKEGLFRKDINADILSRYRLESLMVLFNQELFPPGLFNLADLSTATLEHFLYGLSTLKGHELISSYKIEGKRKNKATIHKP